MDDNSLAELHAPLIPILRHVLALAPLPRAGVALDLACGPGHKAPLLAAALGPGVRLIGVDSDPRAIRALTTDHRPPTTDAGDKEIRRLGDKETMQIDLPVSQSPSLPVSRSGQLSVVGRRSSVVGVMGDALALPLRAACCDAAFCIAALGLFADQRAALRELRRVLRPGGIALLVVGAHMWAQAIAWPADLAACLGAAYAQALAAGAAPLPAAPDLGGELANLLAGAGFAAPLVRAFRLDTPTADRRPPTTDRRPPTADRRLQITDHGPRATDTLPATDHGPRTTDHGPRTTDSPLDTELPLLQWPALRALLAGRLATADLARCDQAAAAADVELCALALIALARAP